MTGRDDVSVVTGKPVVGGGGITLDAVTVAGALTGGRIAPRSSGSTGGAAEVGVPLRVATA